MKKKKNKSVFNLLAPFLGKYKFHLYMSSILAAVSGMIMLVPLVGVWLIVKKAFQPNFSYQSIKMEIILITVSLVANIIIHFAALMFSHIAGFKIETNMQSMGLNRLLKKDPSYILKTSTGKLRNIVNDSSSKIHTFVAHNIPDVLRTTFTPLGLLVICFFINYKLGLICLMPLVVAFISSFSMWGKKSKAFMEKYQEAQSEMTAGATEYVRGVPVVKAYGNTVSTFKHFVGTILNYRNNVSAYTRLWKVPMTFIRSLISSILLIFIPFVILFISQGNNLVNLFSDYIFYIIAAPQLSTAIMTLLNISYTKNLCRQTVEKFDKATLPEEETRNEELTIEGKPSITFENVDFTYKGNDLPSISNVSFKLKPDTTTALVGPSGGGKSTIFKLLINFYKADKGEIKINNQLLKNLNKNSLNNNIAVVFQNNHLFKLSIKDNLLLAKPDATNEEINLALEKAQCMDIIDELPKGIDTIYKIDHDAFSGGQVQRLCIARAFLKNSTILIMDEATSFCDPDNSHLINKALQELSKNSTTLVICHRLEEMNKYDNIIYVEQGKVKEEGTHEKLLSKKGYYYSMHQEYLRSINWKLGVKDND